MKICKQCGQRFQVAPEDLDFYKKMGVLEPTLCPTCRHQNRLAWRNERVLYIRTCDKCSKRIVALYPEQTIFPVYCNDCWWEDSWDSMDFGMDYNLNESFFTQYKKLQSKVPRLALHQKAAENSEYTNHSEQLKNCYLTIDTAYSENIYYCNLIGNCHDLIDCYQMEKANLCYESLYSFKSYNCIYIFLSDNCRDSAFLYDCIGCSHCFMCSNLRQKKYYAFNKKYSKEEYESLMEEIDLGSFRKFTKYKNEYLKMLQTKAIVKYQNLVNCENCSGDMLHNCKDVTYSFGMNNAQDCKYSIINWYIKDSYDAFESAFDCELQYNTHGCNRGKRIIVGHVSYDVENVSYVDTCHNSTDLFGCIGLRHKKYCILNKEYSKEEYEDLKIKIIAHLNQAGGYGQFFPIPISPYPYNDTVAQEDFSLTKEQALEKKYRWKDSNNKNSKVTDYRTSDNIKDISENITNEVLTCASCSKNYRVITQELKIYQQMTLPIPHKCPDCRYVERVKLRPPRKLFDRKCYKCALDIKTTYSPDRPEKVLCEKCYLKEVY